MFENRQHAAREIAARLDGYRGRHPLVLAVPRGGVPMGRIVADALGGELDVVLVHKLGAPGNSEYAIGAVDESGHVQLTDAVHRYQIPERYIRSETAAQLERLRQRRERYGRAPVDPSGRLVILVDDGVATGATLLAAIGALRARQPAELVVAIGVAPPEAARRLQEVADRLVCLETPRSFYAVGQFFRDFAQVTDEDVIALLDTESKPP